jgi:Tfp pilus assembly protein PilZ
MDNKRKAILYAALAAFTAAGSASVAANKSFSQGAVVVLLVLMGVFLLIAGYYSGLARRD